MKKISILTSVILCFYGLGLCANENTQQPSTEKESFQLTTYIDENGDLVVPDEEGLLGTSLNQEENLVVSNDAELRKDSFSDSKILDHS